MTAFSAVDRRGCQRWSATTSSRLSQKWNSPLFLHTEVFLYVVPTCRKHLQNQWRQKYASMKVWGFQDLRWKWWNSGEVLKWPKEVSESIMVRLKMITEKVLGTSLSFLTVKILGGEHSWLKEADAEHLLENYLPNSYIVCCYSLWRHRLTCPFWAIYWNGTKI